jgi:threonylcarbamoyladenosine tRNA methylthiotransferase MtaB
VLLEHPKPGQPFHGFTDNYVRVEVADAPAHMDNQLVRVRLGDFNDDKTALKATII